MLRLVLVLSLSRLYHFSCPHLNHQPQFAGIQKALQRVSPELQVFLEVLPLEPRHVIGDPQQPPGPERVDLPGLVLRPITEFFVSCPQSIQQRIIRSGLPCHQILQVHSQVLHRVTPDGIFKIERVQASMVDLDISGPRSLWMARSPAWFAYNRTNSSSTCYRTRSKTPRVRGPNAPSLAGVKRTSSSPRA